MIPAVAGMLGPCSGLEQPRGEGMAVFFDELAVDRFFRMVKRASVAFLPMRPHDAVAGGKGAQFFSRAGQGRDGRPCQIEKKDDPEVRTAITEGFKE